MPRRRTGRPRGRPPHADVLTPAEWRVLEQLRLGHANPQIAARLGIGVETVKYHIENMRGKLGLEGRAELAAWDGVPDRASRRPAWVMAFLLRPIAFAILGVTLIVAALATVFLLALGRDGASTGDLPAATATAILVPAVPAQWTIDLGETGRFLGGVTAIGPDHSVYVAYARYRVDAGSRNPPGYRDVLLARISPDGTLLWKTTFQSDGATRPHVLAVDADGNVYLGGSATGHPGGESNLGGYDGVVIRFNTSGTLVWVRTAGSAGYDTIEALSILPDGAVLAAGGTNAVDGTAKAKTRALLSAYGADGSLISRQDPDIAVVVTGLAPLDHGGAIAIGTTPSDQRYLEGDATVVRLDSSGQAVWRQNLPNSRGTSLVVSDGVAYVGGKTGIVEFEGERVAGPPDGFVAAYDLAGNRLWVARVSTGAGDSVGAMVVAPLGGVIALASLGTPPGAFQYDVFPFPVGGTGTYPDLRGVYLVEIDPQGDARDPVAAGGVASTLNAAGLQYGTALKIEAANAHRTLKRYRIEVSRYR